jgi:hypothetical protein
MPTLEHNDQAEDLTEVEKGSPSNEKPNGGTAETKQAAPSKKVAVKKKTVRKKAAKTAASTNSAKKKKTPTKGNKTQSERPSETEQAALIAGSQAENAPPAQPEQPEKPVAAPVSPAAAAPSQPPSGGGTGLMGFWIKVGASALVIVAGIIGIYSFFSEDEVTSSPEGTQAAAIARGDNAPVAETGAVDAGMAQGTVSPRTTTEYSNVMVPESQRGYGNQPAMNTANTGVVTPGVSRAAEQAATRRWDTATQMPRASHFSDEPAKYRPELYRPLEPEQETSTQSRSSAANQTPSASSVPAPSQYPQPGAYAYPPAPHYYGGYGYPQPGAQAYPTAPYYGGYGRYYPY